MITRQDGCQVYDMLALAEALYFCQHPLEVFCEVPWDGVHWKKVVDFAKQKHLVDLKEYMEWMGETCLREQMEQLIQFASTRLYRALWGENDMQSGENVKKGEQDSSENHYRLIKLPKEWR